MFSLDYIVVEIHQIVLHSFKFKVGSNTVEKHNDMCFWLIIDFALSEKVRLEGETGLSPPVKYSYWPFPRRYFLCGSSLLIVPLFIAALWSPARKGLTSWLLLVMFIVFLLLSHVVSWVRCGTWLYRFLIFAIFLTFSMEFVNNITYHYLNIFQQIGTRVWSYFTTKTRTLFLTSLVRGSWRQRPQSTRN